MIRTYKDKRAGEIGTVCDISGSGVDVYNDFRALIDMVYDHKDVANIFIEAWDSIMEERKIDKNNISNKD